MAGAAFTTRIERLKNTRLNGEPLLDKYFNYREGTQDFLSEATPAIAEKAKYIACHFYVRDGVKHEDGSMGSMRMSPKQLTDLLAFVLSTAHEN
jgi:hypothetical protein